MIIHIIEPEPENGISGSRDQMAGKKLTSCTAGVQDNIMDSTSQKKASRNRHGNGTTCFRSRMVCVCFTLLAALIGCQFDNVFVPEVFLAIFMGRSLQEDQPYAVRKFLNKANKLEFREVTSKERERVRRFGKKENRRERRKRKKDEQHKMREERKQRKEVAHTEATDKIPEKSAESKPRLKTMKIKQLRKASDSKGSNKDTVAVISEAIEESDEGATLKDECPKPREPIWEFEEYGHVHSSKASKRLLIGLYSGWGVYSQLLTKTAHINRAYAQHWHHDVALVHGAALQFQDLDGNCEPPPHRATYDKIPLLQYALEHKAQYDQLLILDTDAMVYKMDFDITTLLPQGQMLAAQKVHASDDSHTWDINAGVTLWDLHHPRIEKLAKEWLKNSKSGMEHDYHASNDQYHLHYTLKKGSYLDDIHGLDEEFNYGHATLVKHFIRKPQHKQWGEDAILDNRENRIDIAIEEICKEHRTICSAVEKKTYVE